MQTLKFKAQGANVFFATTVIQMFCGSFQLPATAEHCFIVWTVFNDLINTHSVVVVRSWGVTAKHLIDSSGKHICQLSFEF